MEKNNLGWFSLFVFTIQRSENELANMQYKLFIQGCDILASCTSHRCLAMDVGDP